VLYIGITNNLERRISEHRDKTTPGFTSRYNLTHLLHYETFPDPPLPSPAKKNSKAGGARER
jgi:putative endonuclease